MRMVFFRWRAHFRGEYVRETFTLNGALVVGDVVHLYSNTGTGLEGLTGVIDSEAQQIELDDYLFLGIVLRALTA